MTEPAYLPNNRLVALQHQLHIATSSHLDIPNPNNWSSLIMPYHNSLNKSEDLQSGPEEERKVDMTKTETVGGKKKNPYSIEELLKKPSKKAKLLDYSIGTIHQPYGGLLITTDEFKQELCDSGSDSEQEKDVNIDVD